MTSKCCISVRYKNCFYISLRKFFSMTTLLGIFIGGGIGSVSRFGLSKIITSQFGNINPVATLVSNLISTAILGVIIFMASEKLVIPNSLKAMIIVGFCGGFSTFSTFSYETFELIRSGHYFYAAGNIMISVGLIVGILFLLARNLS